MTKTPEADIISKMRDVIEELNDPLEDAMWGIYDAADEYDYLMDGCENSDGSVLHVTDTIDNAHREYTEVLKHIVKFDKKLAELIALRGKFAEMTDIPMFSHIGENKRSLIREEYTV